MVGAAVAVGASVAATAASAAAQAANSPDAPDIAVPTFDRREQSLLRQNRSALDEGRTSTEAGAGLLSQLAPEQLKALGFDVQYDTKNLALIQSAQKKVDDLQAGISAAESRLVAAKGNRKNGGDPKAKKEARRERNRLQLELDQAQADLGRLKANPVSITGLSRTPSEAEVQAGNIETGLNEHILAALENGGAVDPALERQYAEEEKVLRQKLARDFGAGYESSTIGQAALHDFFQRKQDAFTTDRRNTLAQLVGTASGYSNDILGRTVTRQDAASAIAGNQLKAGDALQGLAHAFTQAHEPYASLRGQKLQRDAAQSSLDYKAAADKNAALGAAIQAGGDAAGVGLGLGADYVSNKLASKSASGLSWDAVNGYK